MLGSGMNLITTVVGFGMSTTFIVFICTRLICGRVRFAEARAAAASRAITAFDLELQSEPDLQTEHRINGLEPFVVSTLPTMKYSKATFRSNEDAQCSICLGDYQEMEVLRIMPKCGHDFHVACIDAWLRKQSTCPICRLSLQELIEAKYEISSLSSEVLQTGNSFGLPRGQSHQWSSPDRESAGQNESNHETPEIHVSLDHIHVEQTEARR